MVVFVVDVVIVVVVVVAMVVIVVSAVRLLVRARARKASVATARACNILNFASERAYFIKSPRRQRTRHDSGIL